MSKWGISGFTVITPENKIKNATLIISDNKIEKVTKERIETPVSAVIENAVLLPGLINSHDHLLGTYYPKVGNGPYENWLPWDNDLKSADLYAERSQIENSDLYLLGAFRNLLSGVTHVSDLMPHVVQDQFKDRLPLKVINQSLAHSISSFALVWGDSIEEEYKKAINNDIPFVTHCSEGFDPESRSELSVLNKRGGLGDHSVLVHGVGFSDEDIDLIKKKGASVVWCADSNMFMYNRTARVQKLLEAGINTCIGTDSPMSGGMNFLFEMKFDRDLYKKMYNKPLPDETIIRMVTSNPAKAFRMKNLGQIKPGFLADFIVVSETRDDPYDSVVSAELRDILLIVIEGKPVYGDRRYKGLFDSLKIKCQKVIVDGAEKVITGDLRGLTERINKAVGFHKTFPFLPVEFD